jgi:hypothetical protein
LSIDVARAHGHFNRNTPSNRARSRARDTCLLRVAATNFIRNFGGAVIANQRINGFAWIPISVADASCREITR